MNALVLPLSLPAAAMREPVACFHCGESVPDPALTEACDAPAYCCTGCAAAAQWIRDADLGAYYGLRSEHATRVGTDSVDLSAWDRDEVHAQHSRAIAGGREITLLTDGMRCAACAWLIDRALAREAGVFEVSANAVTGRIRLAWDPARVQLSRALGVLVSLGYRPYLATGEASERARRADRRRWLLRLGVAGLGAMQAMMYAEALYLDTAGTMPLPTRDFLRWVAFLVSTPVVFFSGWPFLLGAWQEWRLRRLGMDTLIAGSTLLAYFASLAETLRGGPHVWYDAAVMFVFLLLVARLLEQRARAVANAQVDALARARPAFAVRERADGSRETVPLSVLRPGDIACVAAGETVPADGCLLDGQGRFEEALLTGESSPVDKRCGDPVFAGTLCRERPARIDVAEVGSATRLSQLARLVESAQAHRPALAQVADRLASRFVLLLALAAVATWIAWSQLDPSRAFEVTLALLVISCPCALSLSVPAALATAHGALARVGVLILKPEALERLAACTDVVFDKTGTLGDGKTALLEVEAFAGFERERVLAIAAALERDSGHPLAAAFLGADAGAVPAEAVELVPGQGVRGRVGGTEWRLGRADFAGADAGDDECIWLGDGHRVIARFRVGEVLRPDALEAADALRAQGLQLHLSSGDGAVPVQRMGQLLGIAGGRARQAPEDKLAAVRELQRQGRVVLMVGDGLNDGPVLAGADVSIAIGSGAVLAQQAADIVLSGSSLLRIPQAVAIARRCRQVIRQNLTWAMGYNLLALPLAATGQVTPWVAALGMALSSLAVTANALRLARQRP